jgi:VanZ family protein
VALLVAFYGAFDEVHQLFVPGREGSLGDLGADISGGVISAVWFVKRERVVPVGAGAEEDAESFGVQGPC